MRVESKGRALLVAAFALALAAILAVPALATHTVKFDSSIQIGAGPPAFHGKVKSENHGCVQDRKVRVFKAKRGADRLLGRGRTNRRGHWRIVLDPPPGSGAYYAKVIRREEG